MNNLLKELKKQRKLVSLYYDESDPDSECTGYITDVRGKYILLSKITDDGLADGYILRCLTDIWHVEIDHKFHKRIETLYQLKLQSHPSLILPKENDLMTDVIRMCENMHLVVSINVNNDKDCFPLVGFVSWQNSFVTITELDQYGEPVCLSYVNPDAICSMEIEGLFEQSRHILYDNLEIQNK